MVDHEPTQPSELSKHAQHVLQNLEYYGFLCTPVIDYSPPIFDHAFIDGQPHNGIPNPAMQTDHALTQSLDNWNRQALALSEATPEGYGIIERFAHKKPIFQEISDEVISTQLRRSGEVFGAEQTGAILRLLYDAGPAYTPSGKVEVFPAIMKDDKTYRITQVNYPADVPVPIDQIARAFELLAPPSEVRQDGQTVMAAVEFIEDAERPIRITTEELDDWIARIQEAGVNLGRDFAPGDESLDNLLRIEGRLYWCDGNLISARPLSTDHERAMVAEAHREGLESFVE